MLYALNLDYKIINIDFEKFYVSYYAKVFLDRSCNTTFNNNGNFIG